jgi:tetratricopeptide (TPR) repeat protein
MHSQQQQQHGVWVVRTASEAHLRYKESKSLAALGNVMEASSVLETIVSPRLQTLAMRMELGHLYLASGRHSDAIRCFLAALERNPHALEAIELLVILGADRNDVARSVQTGLTVTSKNKQTTTEDNNPLHDDETKSSPLAIQELVNAHFLMHRNQTANALTQFRKLDQLYPNNVYIMLKIATLQVCFPQILMV